VPDRRRRAAVNGRDADRNSHSYSILVAAQQQQQTAAPDPCLSICSTLQLNIFHAEKNLILIVVCLGSRISIGKDEWSTTTVSMMTVRSDSTSIKLSRNFV